MKTILVIRSSAMGDVAMVSPVVSSLLASYPDIRVVMLTRGFFAPFFEENDRLTIYNIDLHGKHAGIRGIRQLYKELRSEFEIDMVADLHDKLYSKLLTFFFRLAGIKTYELDKGRSEKRALTRRENKISKQLRHTFLRYADVFEEAGIPVNIAQKLQQIDREVPDALGLPQKNEPWIGIAPFAQHAGKILPIRTIKDVIHLIDKKYPRAKVFIFGGGDAEAKIAADMENEYSNCTSVIGKIKLKEELDIIANLDVMLSMDSSAMHMASLVGTRTVSVWGATHPYAGFLGVGQSAEDTVQLDLRCRPCSVYGNKPCYRGDYACLNQITAENIIQKLDRAMAIPDLVG